MSYPFQGFSEQYIRDCEAMRGPEWDGPVPTMGCAMPAPEDDEVLRTGRPVNKLARNPLYRTWKEMSSRCERWESFDLFLKDVGERPTSEHLLCRADPGQPFSPQNFLWETRSAMARRLGLGRA